MSLYEVFLRIINKTDVIVYWSVMFTWIGVIVYIIYYYIYYIIMVCDVYLDLCDSAPSWPTPERPASTSGGPRCSREAWCLSLSCRLKPQNEA